MTDHNERRPCLRLNRPAGLAIFGAGLLALGGVTGSAVMAQTRPSVSMAPAEPVAIRSLSSTGIMTIRGRVAEVYGNKFVMEDSTGRALVDTGREGDERQLVLVNQTVTVQGRFDRGFVHAAFLVGPDSKVLALGPLAGPPHGPHGGPDGRPDRGPGAPPPPCPPAAGWTGPFGLRLKVPPRLRRFPQRQRSNARSGRDRPAPIQDQHALPNDPTRSLLLSHAGPGR